MFSRQQSLHDRLRRTFSVFALLLMLLTWFAGGTYFFFSEREEIRETVQISAAIVAVQSSAALMFGDHQVLTENLVPLQLIKGFRWAAIVPTDVVLPLPVLRIGDPFVSPEASLARLDGATYDSDLFNLTVRAPIVHQQIVRGELLVGIDLHDLVFGFLQLLALSLLLLITSYWLVGVVFGRFLKSVVAPLLALTDTAELVSRRAGEVGMHLNDLPVPKAVFNDEIGQLERAFVRMFDSLNRRDLQMAEQASRLEQSLGELRALSARMRAVREEERTRISHEIHDELGQRLTALKFEIAASSHEEARARLCAQVDDLIRVVRLISWELRPSVLDSLGLVAAIEWQAQDFARRLGVRCDADLPDEDLQLPPDMATDLFRICQELLTNVARHAAASRVDIILEASDDMLYFDVKDNGHGLAPQDSGRASLGLLGVRERLARWGGTLELGPVTAEARHKPAADGTGNAAPGCHIHITIPRGRNDAPHFSESAP